MSKFWGKGSGSDSDESSSSEDSPINAGQKSKFMLSKWALEGSSSEEDDKRVVRSQKDKRWEAMENVIKEMKNGIRNQDFVKLLGNFEELNKAMTKAKSVVDKEGVPVFYTRTLVKLEDLIGSIDAETKKKFGQANAKSFNTLKMKLKKNNKLYESQITKFRAEPMWSEEDKSDSDSESESESESSESSSEESESASESGSGSGSDEDDKDKDKDDEDDEDSDWGSGDSDSSSSDGEYDPQNRRSRWLVKKDDAKDKSAKEKKKKTDKPATVTKTDKKEAVVQQKPEKITDYSTENIIKRLKEIIESRGRKTTQDIMGQLQDLSDHTTLSSLKLNIHLNMIAALFDMSKLSSMTVLPLESWNEAYSNLKLCVEMIETDDKPFELDLKEDEEGEGAEDKDQNEAKKQEKQEKNKELIFENLCSFIERLDEELYKAYQFTNYLTAEYLDRLRDERKLANLIKKLYDYFEKGGDSQKAFLVRTAYKRLEHTYYKLDSLVEKLNAEAARNTEMVDYYEEQDIRVNVPIWADIILQHGDDQKKSRALMMEIYHRALHNDFHTARDLLYMTNLTEKAPKFGLSMQVLFNRTVVQLGLAAFRLGLFPEANAFLQELYSQASRFKECLGQGFIGRRFETLEKEERKRVIPYHHHINLELLECVHLTVAMVLEIPNIASHPHDNNKKVINKTFRRFLDGYSRLLFVGPPETKRDTIMTASRALRKGDWKTACDMILDLKVWKMTQNIAEAKEMITQKIKEAALKTFLHEYSPLYNALSNESLASLMNLSISEVQGIISKMIISGDYEASWDQPTGTLLAHKEEVTKFQYLALQLAEKANICIENNEKLADAKVGSFKKDEDKSGKRYPGGNRGGSYRGGRGGGRGSSRGGRGGSGSTRGKRRYDQLPGGGKRREQQV